MFDYGNSQIFGSPIPSGHSPGNWNVQVYRRAVNMFRRMRVRGYIYRSWERLRNRQTNLFDLTEIKDHYKLAGTHELGVATVPIGEIRGSEGRSQDFDSGFHPIKEHDLHRWAGIASLRLKNEPLEAIELIKLDRYFFVRDGHHRISVARALGEIDIDAHVTEWHLAVALPWQRMLARRRKQPSAADAHPI